MPFGIARIRVEDYERWKRAREETVPKLRDVGITRMQAFRNREDPNDVLVLIEASDMERANRLWTGTEEFRAYMRRAGITDRTAYPFAEELSM